MQDTSKILRHARLAPLAMEDSRTMEDLHSVSSSRRAAASSPRARRLERSRSGFSGLAAAKAPRLVSPLRLAWRRHPGLFRLFRSLTGKQACFATEACLAETSLTGDQARFAAVLGGSEPDTPRLVSRIAQWETGLFPLAAASARSRRAGWECPRAGLARKGHGCRP